MATCLIDAIEGWNVAMADIPGAFLQATLDDDVWIKFENEMVDVLVELELGVEKITVETLWKQVVQSRK